MPEMDIMIKCIGPNYLSNSKAICLRQKKKYNSITEIKNITKTLNNNLPIYSHPMTLKTLLKIPITLAIIIINTKMSKAICLILKWIDQIKLAQQVLKIPKILTKILITRDLDLMTLNKTTLLFIIMLEIFFIQIKIKIETTISINQ